MLCGWGQLYLPDVTGRSQAPALRSQPTLIEAPRREDAATRSDQPRRVRDHHQQMIDLEGLQRLGRSESFMRVLDDGAGIPNTYAAAVERRRLWHEFGGLRLMLP